MLLSISGMSTAGKTFVVSNLPEMQFAMMVSHTTRPIRKGELNGFDYNFVRKEVFEEITNADLFLEQDRFAGYSYGVLKTEVEAALNRAACAVHVSTPSGVNALRREAKARNLKHCSIFIDAPIKTVVQRHLKRWMSNRSKIDIDYLAERIALSILVERSWTGQFNYIVPTSDGFTDLLTELREIAHGKRQLPRLQMLKSRTTEKPAQLKLIAYSIAQRLKALPRIPVTHEDLEVAINLVFDAFKCEGVTLGNSR